MDKILKLGEGYRTYIIGAVMVVHAITQIILDYTSGKGINTDVFNELFTGAGLIALRRAVK